MNEPVLEDVEEIPCHYHLLCHLINLHLPSLFMLRTRIKVKYQVKVIRLKGCPIGCHKQVILLHLKQGTEPKG